MVKMAITLSPKALEALISAGSGGIAGGLLGGLSAALVPHKFDIHQSDFTLTGAPRKRKKYTKVFKRDPIGQALRSALVGASIGATKPWIDEPIKDWLTEQGKAQNIISVK